MAFGKKIYLDKDSGCHFLFGDIISCYILLISFRLHVVIEPDPKKDAIPGNGTCIVFFIKTDYSGNLVGNRKFRI